MSLIETKRAAQIAQLEAENWDLLVIGGGITGAGIALDAASRGIKVALLEMQDFAAGTSSRSTKLIHGGLRYLKQFEFRLVREVGRERAILHKNAGHLVIPEKMLLPIVEGGTFGKLGVWFGLWLYDVLAGVKKEERRVMLSAEETLKEIPNIEPKGLKGAGLYSEYRTDDARLVIEVIKTATEHGAIPINYAKVSKLNYERGTISGLTALDLLTGKEFSVRAKQIVNAAGPWVDSIREMDNSLNHKRLRHTKGVHLVVESKRLPIKESVYFDIEDGRMMFAIPRGPWTYFGTTDTDFVGNLKHPDVDQKDCDYLIKAVNKMFPSAKIEMKDIVSSWAGIRPLIHEAGKGPSELSRKDEVFESQTGLLTIAGGKLTGFRKMAEKIVDIVAKRLMNAKPTLQLKNCTTDQIKLTGFRYESESLMNDQVERLSKQFGMPEKEVLWVHQLFGSATESILKKAEGKDEIALLKATLSYCIEEESVFTLSDFFVRRTALLYFGRPWIKPSMEAAKTVFAAYFGEDYVIDPEEVFAKEYESALHFE